MTCDKNWSFNEIYNDAVTDATGEYTKGVFQNLLNDFRSDTPENIKDLFQECVVFDYRTGYCHVRVLSYVIFNLSLSKEKKNISYKMHHKLGGL
jgi:hypothetical protein